MASLTIRNLDERVKQTLRVRAAARGISMEAEARRVLATDAGIYENKPKMTAEGFKKWLDALPMGEPADLEIDKMDLKTLTDKMWDGEL